MKEDFLTVRLKERKEKNAYRELQLPAGVVDFCSNDYLGIVRNRLLEQTLPEQLHTGSTGSRLLAGNYQLIEDTERQLASFHESEAGLLFNSGYDANLGLLSCIAVKGDTIIYDFLSHASIRDGIRLSAAQSFSFLHNNPADLERRLEAVSANGGNIFVVTESLFSMDGDLAPLEAIAALCQRFNAHLVVDEAHATGVIGEEGAGLVQYLSLQQQCFARIHTFGKAAGCHGAIVLGSDTLRNFLINFCRAFIYTTSLPETSVAHVAASYRLFPGMKKERMQVEKLAGLFQASVLPYDKVPGNSPIQGIIVPGNDAVKALAFHLQQNGFDVRPILYPTVPRGKERLRIVLHSFNTEAQLNGLIEKITYF